MAGTLQRLADGVHVAVGAQRFYGLELGARMTVLELQRGLLVHSPLSLDPKSLEAVGNARWVLAPNLFHHLHVRPWVEAGLEAWAAPGLEKKRPDIEFRGTVDRESHPFGDEVSLFPLTCFSLTNEVVVLHRPSRTLIVSDLVFNLSSGAPWPTRVAMRCLLGYPGCRSTALERIAMSRETARRELSELVELPFDRLVMAHGDVIERDGPAALKTAFDWLLADRV